MTPFTASRRSTHRGGFVGLACLAAAPLWAQLPKGAIVIEAEALVPENAAWQVIDHTSGAYSSYPSGSKMLSGSKSTLGKASATFSVPEAGTYRAWVRYLNDRRQQGAFTVTVEQNGKTVGEETLNKEVLRTTERDKANVQFVWQSVAFTAGKGDATLTLGKPVDKEAKKPAATSASRTVDLFIITADAGYEADVRDAHPLYAKVTIFPEQERPCVIQLDGRRPKKDPGWFILDAYIHRDGIAKGRDVFSAKSTCAKLEPGQSSAWVPVHKHLTFLESRRGDAIFFSARGIGKDDIVTNAAFEIAFSTTPDDSGILLKETRRGSGSGLLVNINLMPRKILTERTGSAQSLAWAKATTPVEGSRPKHFPFCTGMSLNDEISQSEYVGNELDALRIIGINTLDWKNQPKNGDFPLFRDKCLFWHLMGNNCPNDPKTEAIEKRFRDKGENEGRADNPAVFISLMDEPGLASSHIKTCDICAKAFQGYVAKQGVKLDGKPSFDIGKDDPVRYYWSRRFQNNSMTEFFRIGTEAAKKHLPGDFTTCNFSTELIFDGNMVNRGADWYEILRSGALTFGETEDWNNYSATYQTAGFQLATLRAACRPRNNRYGIISVLSRPAWDITAKGFCEIGHGARYLSFSNYGPYYAPTSDTDSHRKEIYQAIKDVTYPTGAVDKHLMDPAARVAKGDAAMLVGVTSDIWSDTAKIGNAHGRERVYLHLLLTHCGYRTDVLDEEDLATELANYKILFVTDSHIRSAYLKPLADWVNAGGTLYLDAGALEYDEYNKPLGADKLLGITREPMQLVEKAGNAVYILCKSQPVKNIGGMPIYVGYQEPYMKAFSSGKGKVLFSGFFPGMSYIASSRNLPERGYSARAFDPAYRDYIKSLNLPVQPRLSTSHPLVEASLIESPEADVITLSNWTGEPLANVTVTLRTAPASGATQVFGKGASLGNSNRSGDTLTLDVKNLDAGGYILLPKKM